MGYRFGKEERARLAAVERYLAAHLHETVRVETLCAIALMSRQKLNAGFVKFYGENVQRLLRGMRMKRARELLRHSEESIGAIAALCGYEHPENFSTAYKRFFGLSPQTERKNGGAHRESPSWTDRKEF